MRKFKQVKRKDIVYGINEWKVIEERAAALSIKTGTYIKRVSLENQIVCYELKEVVPLLNALRVIGSNINQIARKANILRQLFKIQKIFTPYKSHNYVICMG
ncbi:MAG: plasmid mobilization relaxosome protein MobC [Bacteroidales bacterium]|nr:plasmid mobilization relaxosome protein MobC [Bacteroidales bacterium]